MTARGASGRTTGLPVAVVTAEQSAEYDRAAIASGIPSRALMQRAGAAAAGEIARRWPGALRRGIAIYTGPGNNGGDGWVVAGAMAAAGVHTRVREIAEPRTDDARAERESAFPLIDRGAPHGGEEVVVDALLGTGASGSPRGAIADAIREIAERRSHGARIVSLDVPSGLDATTGAAEGSVIADLTLTFGTMKRGLLVSRGATGRIAVIDIGLGSLLGWTHDDAVVLTRPTPGTAAEPRLVDARWARTLRPIPAEAHKGTRGKLAIVGGGRGMAGAAVLAGRAAIASGIGMVRLIVEEESVAVVQSGLGDATAAAWENARESIADWADCVLLGPGLGNTASTRALAREVLEGFRGPVVIDADGLNVFAGDAASLRQLLGERPAMITPHVAELARLGGGTVDAVLADRFEIGVSVAREAGAVVVLKGVPTVISSPGGRTLVSASGTPVLAMGGSGDLLAGIAGTLVAQLVDPLWAGAAAAVLHGRAGEIAQQRNRSIRGVALDDILHALRRVWGESDRPPRPPVLAELPAVGEIGR